MTFDGVTYSVLDVGPGGDSEANSVWFVEARAKRTAFLGDLTFNGTHSYVADGYLLAWLANSPALERLCAGMDIVFPGHGAAAAPEPLIARQRAYLLTLAGAREGARRRDGARSRTTKEGAREAHERVPARRGLDVSDRDER